MPDYIPSQGDLVEVTISGSVPSETGIGAHTNFRILAQITSRVDNHAIFKMCLGGIPKLSAEINMKDYMWHSRVGFWRLKQPKESA